MKEKGFNSLRALIVSIVFVTLVFIVLPRGSSRNRRRIEPDLKTDVEGRFAQPYSEAREKACLYFTVKGRRWNPKYKYIQFKDFWPYGTLDKVFCSMPDVIFDPNSQYQKGESWNDWVKIYEEISKEHSSGLKPKAEDILREREKQRK